MITLEKILTELKAESLNEIVAGNNGKGKALGKGGNPNKGAGGGTSEESAPSETTAATESGEMD